MLSGYRSKFWVWVCGVGVGVALALARKYHTDAVNSSCDDKVARRAQSIHRYGDAIKVSRGLVERIKVGAEEGM